jgi:hypothetical protein
MNVIVEDLKLAYAVDVAGEKEEEDMSKLFSEGSSTSSRRLSKGHDSTYDEEDTSLHKDVAAPVPEPPVTRKASIPQVLSIPATARPDLPKPAVLPDIVPLERRHSSASLVEKPPLAAQTKARSLRPSSATQSSSRKRQASAKMDMSKVLSYLKKNKYDDRGMGLINILN